MNRLFQLAPRTTVLVICAAPLLLGPFAQAAEVTAADRNPEPGQAGNFAVKVEPGLALPLTDPQSRIFNAGGGQTIKALWSVNKYLDLGPSATFIALPAETPMTDLGAAWALGGSLRFKRPHRATDADALHALSPWLDADALYVRTGGLNRPGFAVAAGVAAPIGDSRVFWLGPFVRYFQIVQGERVGFDNHDAKILSVGLSLEVGSGIERAQEVTLRTETRTIEKETFVCLDRDKDGVADDADHCPDVAGPADNDGCPTYEKVVIKRDKLELKEKLYFAWDQTTLQDGSLPVLDDVVQALKDNKSFRVQVEGHASSDGTDEHNQTLSEKRADAVVDYLVAHGIGRDRLVSKGFASSVPADTNNTSAGRENNRRVEFVVQFTILNDGSK